jgi:NIPSNAP
MGSASRRREFLAQSLVGGAAGAISVSALSQLAAADAPAGASRQLYELGVYELTPGEMVLKADDYFERALVPALRRANVGPVGVFFESSKADTPAIYVLVPHAGIESVLTVAAMLRKDAEYQKAGAAFLSASPKNLAYVTHEARLMLAAAFMPVLEVPEKKETRVFELRRYRSPSEAAFRKKLEMFGTAGELAIFRRVGLSPVFFGEMLFGPDLFNITYMLTYPDASSRTKAWGAFRTDPDWQKLRVTSGFTDAEIIANIKSLTLSPRPYSQI